MLTQTQPTHGLPSIEPIDFTKEQREQIRAKMVQEELDQGDFLAIELQKSLKGMELFRNSPLFLQSATIKQVQLNVEPFAQLYELLLILHDRKYRHTCPECKTTDNVVKNGHVQRKCKNSHTETSSKDGYKYFYGTTSEEGHQAITLLGQLVSQQFYGNSTHSFICQLFGVSSYFTEFVNSYLSENLPRKSLSDLDLSKGFAGYKDLLVVFSDFSGSRLSKNTSLLATEIDGEIVWYLYQSPNSTVANEMITDLRSEVDKQGFTGEIVFVTDGEKCWLDAIRDNFEDAIHIRQFHKKSLLGTIFVHFIHQGKEHTLKCKWDLVKDEVFPLPEENEENIEQNFAVKRIDNTSITEIFDERCNQISSSTISQRNWRKTSNRKVVVDQSPSVEGDDSNEDQYQITLYSTRVWTSRGNNTNKSYENSPRKDSSDSIKGTTDVNIDIPRPKVEVQDAEGKYRQKSPNIKDRDVRGGHDAGSNLKKRGRKSYKSSILFKGHIKDGIKEFPWLGGIYKVIVAIFAGLFISSNRAEYPFGLKHRLSSHRTIKAGLRLLQMQIGLNRFANLDEFRDWLICNMESKSLLFHEIVRDKCTITKNNSRKELIQILRPDQYLAIEYTNANGETSIRVLHVVDKVGENGVFKAYCFLRMEERNFQIARIGQFCTLYECYQYLQRNNREVIMI